MNDKDLESSGLLVCARDKHSSRLSGTVPIRELFQELINLIPVDKLFVQITNPDGSITLREAGSIGLEFFPALASPFSPQEHLDQKISALESCATPIAGGPDSGDSKPIPPRKPKVPRGGPKKHRPIVDPTPLSNGELVVDSVAPCPPGKEKAYSKFGKSKH